MMDLKLYTKLSNLPVRQKAQVVHFIETLQRIAPSGTKDNNRRLAGKAKGLITMKDNFDDDIDSFGN